MAARAFELIAALGDGPRIQAALAAEFDVAPARLAADLDRLVDEFVARHLIEIDESPL